MHPAHVIIIGGGLSGLSAGCYARASGFRTTILEHASALGGVCTAWEREHYTIDGCIRWLTGGPFEGIYAELGIVPKVALRPLSSLSRYMNRSEEPFEIEVGRNLDVLKATLRALAAEDAGEIELLIGVARKMGELDPGIARPQELATFRSTLSAFWRRRSLSRDVTHFRKPLSVYTAEHIKSPALRRVLTKVLPEDSSTLFLAMMLGYLERGYISRPAGGSAAFRDALIASYGALGGEVALAVTAEEILSENGHAHGVRLDDGSIVEADYVVSTSSMPETILHLLGGRYGLSQHGKKLEDWKLFGPLLVVSYGIALPLADLPSVALLDQIPPVNLGGQTVEHLSLRIFNDEPSFAPAGHTVVQALLPSSYDYWNTRGVTYTPAKEQISESVIAAIDAEFPGVGAATQMHDVATPLTYWRTARSWRGAYEGWQPSREAIFGQIDKRIEGLDNVYLAGQWVEPGGGVPVSLLSGKHAIQLLCADAEQPFVPGVEGVIRGASET